jgi:hypothetical protein
LIDRGLVDRIHQGRLWTRSKKRGIGFSIAHSRP